MHIGQGKRPVGKATCCKTPALRHLGEANRADSEGTRGRSGEGQGRMSRRSPEGVQGSETSLSGVTVVATRHHTSVQAQRGS